MFLLKKLLNSRFDEIFCNLTVLPKDNWCFCACYLPNFKNFFCAWASDNNSNFWHHLQPHEMSVLPELSISWKMWVNKFHPRGLEMVSKNAAVARGSSLKGIFEFEPIISKLEQFLCSKFELLTQIYAKMRKFAQEFWMPNSTKMCVAPIFRDF